MQFDLEVLDDRAWLDLKAQIPRGLPGDVFLVGHANSVHGGRELLDPEAALLVGGRLLPARVFLPGADLRSRGPAAQNDDAAANHALLLAYQPSRHRTGLPDTDPDL